MNPFFWIVRKDLAVFFSDRRGALMVIVMPLALGLLMGLIFAPSDGPSAISVTVVDEDHSPAVAALITRFDDEPTIEVVAASAEEARAGVEAGKIGVALRFSAGAGAKLTAASLFTSGDRGGLTLWVDPSRKTEADIVSGLLTKAMMETVFAQIGDPGEQRRMFESLRAGAGESRPELAKFLEQGVAFSDENAAQEKAGGGGGMSLRPPLDVQVEEVVAAGPTAGFSSYAHTFAGMLMQFLLFSASSHAKALFAERNAGTLDRVRTTRAGPATILLGTATAVAIVALLATVVVFGVGVAVFDVPLRSGLPSFGIVAVAQALFVGAFTLLLAGLAHSEKQLDAVGTLIVLLLCFVSGAWVPAFMLPKFIQSVGFAIPTRWILDGMAGATWRGLGLGHALTSAGVLLGFSAVFAAIGVKRFRWG